MNCLWQAEGIKKYFVSRRGFFGGNHRTVHALNGITMRQQRGETLGIVGESGCGKSTLGRILMGLYTPTAGELTVEGRSVTTDKDRQLLHDTFQMVFQDPYASLNPRMTVRQTLAEPLKQRASFSVKEKDERIDEMLHQVGLRSSYADRYPHEFSGGQRQRVGIARALMREPACIICDEPISALDVSIQVQIVSLLEKLQVERGLSYVFISHDLSMVRYLSHRIAVMYLGFIVEEGPAEEIYTMPRHPYTQALIRLHQPLQPRMPIGPVPPGEVPSPLQLPQGCPFASRCAEKEGICLEERPVLKGNTHKVACWKR